MSEPWKPIELYSVEELFTVIKEKAKSVNAVKIPAHAAAIFAQYANRKVEHFLIITLNGAHEVIKLHEITKGLVNRTLIHPREVFRPAIKDNATAIICAHNHPSGNTEPSPEDREITTMLKKAGQLLGITVLDHMIISNRGFFSFQENGDL